MTTGSPAAPLEVKTASNKKPFVFMTLLMGIIIPPLALIAGMILAWNSFFGPLDLALFFGMYMVSGFGITFGFHRFFSHKSFDAPKPVIFMLGVMGSMAMQGPIFWWVSTHRLHHAHSDHEKDPHSPHAPGEHSFLMHFWHSHIGWLFRPATSPVNKYVPDLRAQPMLRFIDSTFLLWAILGVMIPAVLGGLITMTWMGALTGLIWGGLVRILAEHHATWSVNSICHLWGDSPYKSNDESKNNAVVGVLALGEGWHNNHHAFPTSARHGLRWWQFDSSWVAITTMKKLGLVSNVKVPSPERQEMKLRKEAPAN